MNAWTAVYSSVLFILENGALEKWKYSWAGDIDICAAVARERTDNRKPYRNRPDTLAVYPEYPGTVREHRVIFFSYQRDAYSKERDKNRCRLVSLFRYV